MHRKWSVRETRYIARLEKGKKKTAINSTTVYFCLPPRTSRPRQPKLAAHMWVDLVGFAANQPACHRPAPRRCRCLRSFRTANDPPSFTSSLSQHTPLTTIDLAYIWLTPSTQTGHNGGPSSNRRHKIAANRRGMSQPSHLNAVSIQKNSQQKKRCV